MDKELTIFDLDDYKVLENLNKLIQKKNGKILTDTQATFFLSLLSSESTSYKEIAERLGLTEASLGAAARKLFKLLNKIFPHLAPINKNNIKKNVIPIMKSQIISKDPNINNKLNQKTLEKSSSFSRVLNQDTSIDTQNNLQEYYEFSIKIPVTIIRQIDKIAQEQSSNRNLSHSQIILDALQLYIKNYNSNLNYEQKQQEKITNVIEKNIYKIIVPELKEMQENNINEIKHVLQELASNILTNNNPNLDNTLNKKLKPTEELLNSNLILKEKKINTKNKKENSISNNIQVEKGLTDCELASIFGVSKSIVKRWRLGSSKPRGNNLKRLKNWEVKGDLWYKKETFTSKLLN